MTPHCSTSEDPPSLLARAFVARAPRIACTTIHPEDPLARATLQAWLAAIPILRRRRLTPATRTRLADCRRICLELLRVLEGAEAGEGRAAERTLHVALARSRVHAMSSMFACPGGTFIELLVTAPWNLLSPEDPQDPRSVRGAGTALVAKASEWSRLRGCGGAVALQAANQRVVGFYDHLGFREMRPEDRPLALVPRGDAGWSRSITRVARGRRGAEERRCPWLLLEARRARRAAALRATG